MARILTVSDQPDWSAVVLAALAEHQVDPATGPEQARRLLRTGAAYDLALVDLQRSTGGTTADGPDELIDLLWSRYPGTLRVVVAAASPPAATAAGTFARYGVEQVLAKPDISPAALRRLVEAAVEQETAAEPRIRRAELRRRYQDWRQRQRADLDARIRTAEIVAGNIGELDSPPRRRAQATLHDLLAQRDRFTIDLHDVGMRIERTVTVQDLLDSADALAGVEERYAEAGW